MQRRSFLAVLPLGALLAACSPAVPTQWLIGTETIEAALQRRFPHDLPLAGLLQLSLAQPVLTLHPPTQQIEALLQAALSGPALGKVYTGAVSLRCTLVFDAATASVQAQQVQVQQMRLDGAPEALAQMFSAYGPYVVEHVLQDWPLYTLSAEQQQQLSRLHLAVGDITVHAAARRHPLHVAFAKAGHGPERVGVVEHALAHQGDGFKPPVRVHGEARHGVAVVHVPAVLAAEVMAQIAPGEQGRIGAIRAIALWVGIQVVGTE